MDTIILEDGKYEFRRMKNGSLLCYRHGESWRDFVGDRAVGALFDECLERMKKREGYIIKK